jgi:large subunit ribosomal protein L25
VVELVEGKTSYLALVHHIQFHPATDQLMHVDMFAVDEKVPVTVKVPITFSGNSPVVRDMGGVLKYNLKKVKIKALIKDLVENINVDISVIDNFGAAVRVSNLVAPEGVEIVSKDQSALIVSGSAPRGQAYREDEEGSEESEESAEAEAPAATE